VFGGEFIVDGASGIAKSFGMEERVIGLVIVGPGTSFPELIMPIPLDLALNTAVIVNVAVTALLVAIYA
jgi:cation:H+ antiporter